MNPFERLLGEAVFVALGALALLFVFAVAWFVYEYRKEFNRKDPFGFDGERDDDAQA